MPELDMAARVFAGEHHKSPETYGMDTDAANAALEQNDQLQRAAAIIADELGRIEASLRASPPAAYRNKARLRVADVVRSMRLGLGQPPLPPPLPPAVPPSPMPPPPPPPPPLPLVPAPPPPPFLPSSQTAIASVPVTERPAGKAETLDIPAPPPPANIVADTNKPITAERIGAWDLLRRVALTSEVANVGV